MERSLTLLRLFLVASAAILVGAGMTLASFLTETLRSQAIADTRSSLSQYVDGVLRPELVRGGRIVVAPHVSARLRGELERRSDLLSVKVWRADGVLAWASHGQDRIGRRVRLTQPMGEALDQGTAVASVGPASEDEEPFVRRLGGGRLLEVYVPIAGPNGKAVGAYEIEADAGAFQQFAASRTRLIWAVVAGVFVALALALALLVRGASRVMRRQTSALREQSQELLESYRRLEQSSLEAVETLNATVEAKDPYTAGHSRRVQQVALTIGQELRFPADRLDTLRLGALFHDIGKLAVPDAVLTKAGRLTPAEFETIKRHSADGAQIVGKFGRLRATVPLIRHHHERWDGRGYPDGLAAEEIPLDAAIVGLADAWDAMTTDRPYQRALTFEEAARELRRGRGEQFAPAVVDAFFAALRRGALEVAPAPVPLLERAAAG